jgi:spermidine synthase
MRSTKECGARTALSAINLWIAILAGSLGAQAETIFEATSPYHHILVVDANGIRTLSFDGSMETRMSLQDPLKGHFEYTEYFHMPWLWNSQMTNVLMMGLGGGSTQRAYGHYYPDVTVETVEIDPMVVKAATNYFHFKPSPTQRVHVSDGRVFLRRTQAKYGAIIMDAYAKNRYGSFIPYHLATKEFFQMATNHLTPNGVLAYNVIGTMQGWQADILGSIYRTMKLVFPEVYFFPAKDSFNVVFIGTTSDQKTTFQALHQKATELQSSKRITLPGFANRLKSFRTQPPPNYMRCPILTDDFAPVDGLLMKVK